jgi:hypothetical protein
MYEAVQRSLDEVGYPAKIVKLESELPPFWGEVYAEHLARHSEIYRLHSGSFVYLFDDHDALVAKGILPDDGSSESRLVAAFGRSATSTHPRKVDDRRLKGWLGPTEARFGKKFDKGHFIAHSIGGAVDQAEFNVFVQLRAFNRGWSVAGKPYRKMEEYCREHPGTFCFSRPFYSDGTSRPAWLEFGLLKEDGALWVEIFDNRPPGEG